MTKTEALKLALEFIEDINRGEEAGSGWRRSEIINAIKESLAHPSDSIKQEWVGLTDDESYELMDTACSDIELLDLVEAKLKEKNYD